MQLIQGRMCHCYCCVMTIGLFAQRNSTKRRFISSTLVAQCRNRSPLPKDRHCALLQRSRRLRLGIARLFAQISITGGQAYLSDHHHRVVALLQLLHLRPPPVRAAAADADAGSKSGASRFVPAPGSVCLPDVVACIGLFVCVCVSGVSVCVCVQVLLLLPPASPASTTRVFFAPLA